MSNNAKIEMLRSQILEVETKALHEQNIEQKIEYLEKALELREKYTPLLLKKRALLLILGITFAIFYGISLMICIPPFVIRGKKRDINEDRIKKIKVEIKMLKSKLPDQSPKQKAVKTNNKTKTEPTTDKELELLKKELAELKAAQAALQVPTKNATTKSKKSE